MISPKSFQSYYFLLFFLDWLLQEKVQKLSLIISNRNTKEVLERWDFKLQYDKSSDENDAASVNTASKTDSTNAEKDKIGKYKLQRIYGFWFKNFLVTVVTQKRRKKQP